MSPNAQVITSVRWSPVRRLSFLLASAALLTGAILAWSDRHYMNPDGISYLDLGDAFFQGRWGQAVSLLWSPLYPLALGLGLALLRPEPYWEFAVAHLINFALYTTALAAFSFFTRQLLRYRQSTVVANRPVGWAPLPDWALLIVGYAVFTWSALELISLRLVTPDLGVAALVYLAAGIMLKTYIEPESLTTWIMFGLVLGAGYLMKSPMLPMAFVFFCVGFILHRSRPDVLSVRILAALATFVVVSGVLVGGLYMTKGRLTVGAAARLAYAWMVNGVPRIHWQGEQPGSGVPQHPTRRILTQPPLYEFARPVSGTYPPWYDPAYWYEGIRPRFVFRDQALVLGRNLKTLYGIFIGGQWSVISGALVLAYFSRKHRALLRELRAYLQLVVPAIAAIGMFLLIHLEPRYIGGFVTMAWMGVFASIPLPDQQRLKSAAAAVVVAMSGALLMPLMVDVGIKAFEALQEVSARRDTRGHEHWQVARSLHEMGIAAGAEVAVVGHGIAAYWARLGHFRIVAEIPLGGQEEFLLGSDALKLEAMRAFAAAGARAVVMRSDAAPAAGWQRLGRTGYFVYLLPCPTD